MSERYTDAEWGAVCKRWGASLKRSVELDMLYGPLPLCQHEKPMALYSRLADVEGAETDVEWCRRCGATRRVGCEWFVPELAWRAAGLEAHP